MKKPEEMKKRNDRLSLYDLDTPAVRKGISGWKLTKRPMQADDPVEQLGIFPGSQNSSILNETAGEVSQMKRKKSKSKKHRATHRQGEVTLDGRKIQVGGNSLHEHEEHDTA